MWALGYFCMLCWTSVVVKGLETILRDQVRKYFEDSAWLGSENIALGKKGIYALLTIFLRKTTKASELERENWDCAVRNLLGTFSLQM